jgi:DNA-binding NarL/FixJ family response regulator
VEKSKKIPVTLDYQHRSGVLLMIRILVADDQNLIRQALQVYLETESDLKVVAHADDGLTALEKIEQLSPDIALIDLDMPGMDGLTTTRIIAQRFTNTKVLVFSSHDREDYINDAIQSGARGYLLKSTPAEELASAIRYVNKGYFHLGPGLFEKLIVKFALTKPVTDSLVEWESNFQHFLDELELKMNANSSMLRKEFSGELNKQQFDTTQEIQKRLESFQYKLIDRLETVANSSMQTSNNVLIDQELGENQNLITNHLLKMWESQRKLEKQVNWLNRYFVVLIIVTLVSIIAQILAVVFAGK